MTTHGRGFGHPKCYARALNDCGTVLSGEHSVSEGILKAISLDKKTVEFNGKPWQPPGVTQRKGISSLVTNTLCQVHNSRLSDFDAEGIRFVEAIMDLHDNFHERRIALVHEFYGPKLERCLLKTLCAGIVGGDLIEIGGKRLTGWTPPVEWLNILFRNSDYAPGCGMYIPVHDKGEVKETDSDVLKISAHYGPDGEVWGFSMILYYVGFYLVMDQRMRSTTNLQFGNLLFRPATLQFEDVKGTKETLLQIKWGGHRSSAMTVGTVMVSTRNAQ